MASAPLLDDTAQPNAIVLAVNSNPGLVLLDTEKFDVFYEQLKAEAPTDADVSTKKGRDQLRSYATDVRSKKAAIDKDRLRLTKEWRDMTAQCNAAGKVIEERLEALAVEVRKPLTDWEEAEKARKDAAEATIKWLREAAVVTIADNVDTVRERGTKAYETVIDDTFGDLVEQAQAAKDNAIKLLRETLAVLIREEEERAELERLRAEAAERERVEAERRADEERAAAEAEQARLADERRAAAEKAAAERIAKAESDAAEKARREAEVEAQRKLDAERQAREAAEAEVKRLADEAARRERVERDRIAAEELEQARRDADQKHRTAVKTKVKQALMTCGADEDTARKIVLALQAGEIPHVTMRF